MLISFDKVMEDCDHQENFVVSPGCKTENVGFFTCLRVDRNTLPPSWYMYNIRHGDGGGLCTIEHNVAVNHAGTFLTRKPIKMNKDGYHSLCGRGGYSFM